MWKTRIPLALATLATAAASFSALAQSSADDLIRDARQAFVRKDKAKLANVRSAVMDARHPLAPWADYWALNLRLPEARSEDLDAFYARWPGSYVEDRLRNDWLLELGRRRDWATFSREVPRFKMNDDREVNCYRLLAEHQAGKDVREAARKAWMAQREADDGCHQLAKAQLDSERFMPEDVWRKVRHATEHARLRQARQAASLLGDNVAASTQEALDNPSRFINTRAIALGHARSELASIALGRLAASDPTAAARLLEDRWAGALGGEHGAWAWAQTAKQAALALRPESLEWSRNAWDTLKPRLRDKPDWSDETLGWHARAALRLGGTTERWVLAMRAMDAMSPEERADPTWRYWRARALQALAKPGSAGDEQREQARDLLKDLSDELHFYGQLASEDLGAVQPLPPKPAAPTAPERDAARSRPGLQRALAALALGLRSEGLREWNFSLIGMTDRELLAAAQLACSREIWDRCINTSERSKAEVDMEQRFPWPLREEVVPRAREAGLEPAYVYGLIRQESRFMLAARSHVGASGLMQIMPATASWTAKRIGLPYKPEMITDRDTNLRLGNAYLKMVLEDLGGSQAMAAAAYNAGPNRPRRWREGPVLETAIWIENIPLHETRDYVKRVLSNASYYAGLAAGRPVALKPRLGNSIGPRDTQAPAPDRELP
ncbi:transglycosylase SLT domain-containing protein [Ideonella sp.]|jgi:soluble lytic murein transglycosylase|uniref:lytic transglycosylase domain-containing protein n=1 Tax=Ideonella sp. TaxID=1929293 RepID=UPI0037BF1622